VPRIAPVNVHGSLLPAYRGAAPIQRALMDGVSATGVTTIWMNERMDEGDVLMQVSAAVQPTDTTGTLTARLADAGADLLTQTISGLAEGGLPRRPQRHDQATYAPPIVPDDAVMRWTESAQACDNRVRAMAPRPGAVATIAGRRLKVLEAAPRQEPSSPARPGVVTGTSSERVHVATGAGELALIRVQPDSGKEMSAGAWARGARICADTSFDLCALDQGGNGDR
jgi:methionyl-tRNA formyltransferase